VRPLLAVTRAEIEAYLRGLGQDWREDSSNRHLTFTRNRIRHELLPLLEGWNPRLREHLAQMAQLARDEEAWWQAELARLTPQLILPGRPARGGGRAAGLDSGLAIEVPRLAALAPALQRRLLRHAAQQLGVALDFAATEAVRSLALGGRAGQRLALPQGLHAERTARELSFSLVPDNTAKGKDGAAKGKDGAAKGKSAIEQEQQYSGPIPGVLDAPAFGVRLRIERVPTKVTEDEHAGHNITPQTATLRNWRPGDRVRLRYSGGLRKVKEVLERKHVTGTERAIWPVLVAGGQIVWMRGVELEPVPGLTITAEEIPTESPLAPSQNRPKAE
jgi:tRNA(Ile)-lysidine synthase